MNGTAIKALGPLPTEWLRDWTDEELVEHVIACRVEGRRQAGLAASAGDSTRGRSALAAAFNLDVRRARYSAELERRGIEA